jgi:hypothetical protein
MDDPANDPEAKDGVATPDPTAPDEPAAPEESGLHDGRSKFSRRLATFGLGEAQQPLLTEEIWSLDAKGNPR